MKEKILLTVIATVILLAVFFAPIPKSPCRDGGTREYTALTYKIVDWNRLTTDGVYEATRFYWFPNNFRSLDELWKTEEENVVHDWIKKPRRKSEVIHSHKFVSGL